MSKSIASKIVVRVPNIKVNGVIVNAKFVAKPKVVVVRSRGLPVIRVKVTDGGYVGSVGDTLGDVCRTPAKAFDNIAQWAWKGFHRKLVEETQARKIAKQAKTQRGNKADAWLN